MGELFHDWFRELPHCLKPESTRDENYKKLRERLDIVRNKHSQEGMVEQALLNQAMTVFKDEQRYRNWRKKWEAKARGESKRDGEDEASRRKAEMAHERARKAEEAHRREAEKARALERELEEAKQQAARAEREKKEAADAAKRPLWANLHLKIVGGAIGILVLTLWLYSPSQRIPPPPDTPTPPEAAPARKEEKIYREARGNLYNLRAYVNGCQICSHKSEAQDEIRKLERDELAEEEARTYRNGRGNIDSLRAYASSCQICVFKSAVLAEIRDLENKTKYFSFEVCNSTSYVAYVAVVGRKNTDSDRWTVEGWWSVSANSCRTVGAFAKRQFYSMAKVQNDSRGWHGNDIKQCVEFPGPFETVLPSNSSCGTNGALVGFQEFNVSEDQFTWRLTGEPSWSVDEFFTFQVCNKSGRWAAVAVSGREIPGSDSWMVQGWWRVAPGQCNNIGRYVRGYFYATAEELGGPRRWSENDTNICVEHPGPFKRIIDQGYTCSYNDLVSFKKFFVSLDNETLNLGP